MTNQWFFAGFFCRSLHTVQLLIKYVTSEFIVGQYITYLALCKHVSAPGWLLCILVSITGGSTFEMITRFPLKITPR